LRRAIKHLPTGAKIEKKDTEERSMGKLSHLNKYFWRYRFKLGLGIVFIIATNLFAVYSPVIVREAFDLVAECGKAFKNDEANFLPSGLIFIREKLGLDLSSYFDFSEKKHIWESAIKMAGFFGLLYLLLYILKGIFLFYTRQAIIVMSRNIEFDLKNEIFRKYQELSQAFYKRNNTGDLMNRISEDVSQVRMYIGPGVMYTINLIVLFFMTITFMINVSLELTFYVLLPLPVMSVLIYYVSTIINKRSERVQFHQSNLSTLAQEAFSGIRVLKAYTREKAFSKDFTKASEEFKIHALRQVKVDAMFHPIIICLIGLSTIITIYIGGLKAIAGEITIGNIAEFVIYVNMLTWPFAAVGWVTSLTQRAAASQQRISEFLDTDVEIKNTNNTDYNITGEITFNKVSFEYPDSGIKALKDISFTIKQGETLAVVGKTGSGKSTIANLICRHFDPSTGEILVDNQNLINHNLNQLRAEIGYVPQDVFLFSDSIANNIAFGLKEPASNDLLIEASKDAHIYHNILDFKHGFKTVLGERGITLSGGQKQRVSIARALIKKPKILIFDDCLSAVDTETEEIILTNLKRIMQQKTTLLISHRISTVKNADNILVIEDGVIAEQGTHNSLIEQNGIYNQLYLKQLAEDSKITEA